MAIYDDLHGTTDYPWTRAFAEVMYSSEGSCDSWLLFEVNHNRKIKAPQDTVYTSIGGDPVSVSHPQFDNIREQMQAVIDKNGWDTAENPPDACTGDPRTVANPNGWGDDDDR